ncbi:MAG: hypothetical protein P1P64_10110 [Treponemataceae bacterium]
MNKVTVLPNYIQYNNNACFSRKDALAYSTNRTVSYTKIAKEYPESFFVGNKSKASQMYDDKGSFYDIIEGLRHNTANGMIHGEVIDSENTYSEKVFFEELLRYCSATGVEVISKAKAYDICFNHLLEDGNLIYNPNLRNTAKEFLTDAENIPSNPDGYIGDCEVKHIDKTNCLITNSETYYLHYGIPLGNIIYGANVKGQGNIFIYAIKNNSKTNLDKNELELLANLEINSDLFKDYQVKFYIPNNPITDYEQVCEGLGNKIMGVKIVYSSDLVVKNIILKLGDAYLSCNN